MIIDAVVCCSAALVLSAAAGEAMVHNRELSKMRGHNGVLLNQVDRQIGTELAGRELGA